MCNSYCFPTSSFFVSFTKPVYVLVLAGCSLDMKCVVVQHGMSVSLTDLRKTLAFFISGLICFSSFSDKLHTHLTFHSP